jgi:rhodanese-related sulfurtransferase
VGDRAAKQALFDEFARVGKALASGRRIELLDVLANGEVFELWRALRTLAASRLAEVERLAAAYLGARDQLEPITRHELARRLEEGDELVMLDVRPAEEHAAGHLPGAVSIPLAELRERLRELPGDREIVAYCRGPFCAFAHEAVEVLTDAGLTARRLEDGLPEWAAAGLAVTRS